MKFGEILNKLNDPKSAKGRFTRQEWSDHKYIVLMNEQCINECFISKETGENLGVPEHRSFRIEPFLLVKTKYDYSFKPYNANWEDFTAQDWEEII